jgi:hypothetical protein
MSVILYPIDLIKVRYQVYDKTGNAYQSLRAAFRIILQEEGLKGLYQVGDRLLALHSLIT